jgi:broad specificity phosphatase PhoE
MRFYLIRHGETSWNVENKPQGQEADIPLTTNGIAQATKTALYLKSHLALVNDHIRHIYSSPMERTLQTATIIADILKLKPIKYKDQLKERKVGKYSGLTPDDEFKVKINEFKKLHTSPDPIVAQFEHEKLHQLVEDKFHIGLESNLELENRAEIAIKEIMKEIKNDDSILIISHGAFLQALLRKLFCIPRLPMELEYGGNCWISLVEYLDGKWRMLMHPNTLHLKE